MVLKGQANLWSCTTSPSAQSWKTLVSGCCHSGTSLTGAQGQTLLKLPRTSDSNRHSWEPLAKYCLGCQVLKYDSLPNPELSCYFMSSNHTFSAVLIATRLLFPTVREEGTKQALTAQGRWAEESINHQCCKGRRRAAYIVILFSK